MAAISTKVPQSSTEEQGDSNITLLGVQIKFSSPKAAPSAFFTPHLKTMRNKHMQTILDQNKHVPLSKAKVI